MDWFDENDSEVEEEHNRAAASSESRNVEKSKTGEEETTGVNEEEEEEDALDVYMKSLEQNIIAPSSMNNTTTNPMIPPPRFEDDNDEEYGAESGVKKRADNVESNETSAEAIHQKFGAKKRKVSSNAEKEEQDFASQSAVATSSFRKVFFETSNSEAGRQWRRETKVVCSSDIDPVHSFAELRSAVGDALLSEISQLGYKQPTTIQSQTLPVALGGRNVLGTAETGQGKTLAYLVPVVTHVLDQPHLAQGETGPIALILVPTRELALQVHKQVKALLAHANGSSKAVIGGQGKYLLQQELRKSGGIEVAVATPGRLLDVLSDKKGLSLGRTTMVVLDEADKMLEMGFEAQVRAILLQNTRMDRQTLMFSATMSRRVEKMANEWLHPDYVRVSVGRVGASSRSVEQHVVVLPNSNAKEEFLIQMLPTFEAVGRTLVFVSTRETCDALYGRILSKLPQQKIAVIHGKKHQSDRTAAVRAFTKGTVTTLFATDLAGRGLDFPDVATVVNFDRAKNLDTHVHRIGRAGRLSKDGEQKIGSAYTLLTSKDADFAYSLKNAFEREGIQVTRDLAHLCNTSRKTKR